MTANNDVLLLSAVKQGEVNKIPALLATGTSPDAKDDDGTTALMFAANFGYAEIAKTLIHAGANINASRKVYGLTPLMLASNAKQVDVMHLLIDQGVDVNSTNEDGSTALMAAVFKGHLEVVEVLLAAGADVNIKDNDDDTALKLAVRTGNKLITQ